MHLHTAAAVYKEATRPATERGSTSFSTTPQIQMPENAKWKLQQSGDQKLSQRVKTVRALFRKRVRILRRVSHKFISPT